MAPLIERLRKKAFKRGAVLSEDLLKDLAAEMQDSVLPILPDLPQKSLPGEYLYFRAKAIVYGSNGEGWLEQVAKDLKDHALNKIQQSNWIIVGNGSIDVHNQIDPPSKILMIRYAVFIPNTTFNPAAFSHADTYTEQINVPNINYKYEPYKFHK